jgi:hypothetical protein
MPRETPSLQRTRGQIRWWIAAVLVALGGVALVAPAPASAAVPCWKRLINDWYDGRIDQAYPVACYREAIKKLPEDVKAYSSAREDIRRALLAAFRENGGLPPGSGLVQPPGAPRNLPDGVGGNFPDREATGNDGVTSRKSRGGPLGAVFDLLAPGNADSVPLPLIVLAALAMLLLAAAGAGLVTRRLQARRMAVEAPFDGDPPPVIWPQSPPLRR